MFVTVGNGTMSPERMSTEKYLSLVMAAISEKAVDSIDSSELFSKNLLGKLLDRIAKEWELAKSKEKTTYASDLLRLYDKLSPSSGTGEHDMFETYLRNLQPAFFGTMNPTNREIKPSPRTSFRHKTTPEQRQFAADSAAIILMNSSN